MATPHLYRQLMDQLRQWIVPQDQRHLQGVSEAVAAILHSGSACLSHWVPYLSHRNCHARSHLERLHYLVRNPHIRAQTFYAPVLRHLLNAFAGTEVVLTLDTSVLWDEFCLVAVCLVWGGRSISLAQVVLEHGSATVGFEDYRSVLEQALTVLPTGSRVTLLADRGFEHGELMRWCQQQDWAWCIRAKSDLRVTLATGDTYRVDALVPPPEHAYLFHQVTVLGDIHAHLATAHLRSVQEPWAVLSNQPPSLQTFALYGTRFGGIEPHFKDYKSAAFGILQSQVRDASALTALVMLLDLAALIALVLGLLLVRSGQRSQLDGHQERGLSFLQLGRRYVQRLYYQGRSLPPLAAFPRVRPPTASASLLKRDRFDRRIQFSRVVSFSS